MIKFAYIIVLIFVMSALPCLAALDVQRFPPPEFKETGHELPITTVPEPRGDFYEYFRMVFGFIDKEGKIARVQSQVFTFYRNGPFRVFITDADLATKSIYDYCFSDVIVSR